MNITVISVNFMTKKLITDCFQSFRSFYPSLPFILVDNGSDDDSTRYIEHVGESEKDVLAILNRENLGHGPALHQGICAAKTRYVFTIDSDCIVQRGGFLEQMLAEFQADPELFALGSITPAHKSGPVLYLAETRALMDREKYLELSPFIDHGAPAINTMIDVWRVGLHLKAFPIDDYIEHLGSGTMRLFDYPSRPWHPPREARHEKTD